MGSAFEVSFRSDSFRSTFEVTGTVTLPTVTLPHVKYQAGTVADVKFNNIKT